MSPSQYNTVFSGKQLDRGGFPLGGIGAGMIALEGSGKLAQVSIRHHPRIFFEPLMFSAIHIRGMEHGTRVLEGPVPDWKLGSRWEASTETHRSSGNGFYSKTYGLPHFESTTFSPHFPFATVEFAHKAMPLHCVLTAFSPFVPTDSESASLPVASLEYTFSNRSDRVLDAVYSFHCHAEVLQGRAGIGQPEPPCSVMPEDAGFVITHPASPSRPHDHGEWGAWCDAPETSVDCAWYRGKWFDSMTMLMHRITSGDTTPGEPHISGGPGAGGSLYAPFTLKPGESRSIRVLLSWYVPVSDLSEGLPAAAECDCANPAQCTPLNLVERESNEGNYRPWYASHFSTGQLLRQAWRDRHNEWHEKSSLFSRTFFDSTLPAEVLEAVSANLCILKSPTLLRQHDGRLWAWEGCADDSGCCHGSCTHVWNYAQAICHLFPDLERSLRETEFTVSQNDQGNQNFRSALPISTPDFKHHAAADGQLGGIMKLYRDWRIGGDTDWLRRLWPAAAASIEYCIRLWDPDETGMLVEPHHNTYDIEFWGPDGMCTSFYLGALQAATEMAEALEMPRDRYNTLYERGRRAMENQLFDGEYFVQDVRWKDLKSQLPHELNPEAYSTEAIDTLQKEGPKYQYGKGCLSDGVVGAWLGRACGLEGLIDSDKERSHLQSVFRYNFRTSLADHLNPQRSGYACKEEPGLLLCSWPKGGRLSLPFVYSEEVWTGVEYQVASHLMMLGRVADGLTIVRATRSRYNGVRRSPFNEIECGHWYARALASYGLLQGITGIRYDAIEGVLTVAPKVPGGLRSFLSTATGFGTVVVHNDKVDLEVVYGTIEVKRIDYRPYPPNEAMGIGS